METDARLHYRDGMPFLGETALRPLEEHLSEWADKMPKKPSIIHKRGDGQTEVVNFSELHGLVQSFAQFAFLGDDHETMLPIYMSKSPRCVAALIGCLSSGLAAVSLNRKLRGPQLLTILHQCEARRCLMDGPGVLALRTALSAELADVPLTWYLVPDVLASPSQRSLTRGFAEAAGVREWSPVEGKPAIVDTSDRDRIGVCLFTSGSTGAPKGVMITEHDLRARAVAEVEWFGLTEADVLLSILPLSFDVGLNQLMSAIVAGCTLVIADSWLPADILNIAAEYAVTGISSVPAVWQDMMNARLAFDKRMRHKDMRYITISGGDLPAPLLERVPLVAQDISIFKTYGQTEAFRATSLRPDEFDQRPSSVGRAFTGVDVMVVRPDGSRCNPGEQGEVVHAGLGVMAGYVDGSDEEKVRAYLHRTASASATSESLAVFTGDQGYLDEQGYLYLRGRRDGMVKISGNRVYPNEVAAEVLALDVVREAVVIGVKLPERDDELVAFVVVDGIDDVDANELSLQRELSRRLPTYMVPKRVELLKMIERTATGKPDLVVLQKRAAELLQ